MQVVLWTYGSRGDVEPMAALAVALRERGAGVRLCAPPDPEFAELLARIDVPMVPVGQSVRAQATGPAQPASPSPDAAALMANQFEAAAAAMTVAEGCDLLVATGMMPAAAGVRSVAEALGIPFAYVAFQQLMLPSPCEPPLAYPGRPFPPDLSDRRMLGDPQGRIVNALFGAALDNHRAKLRLPAADDVCTYVRDQVIGASPWLATDPLLDRWHAVADLDVVQTGAWILPDRRPLPAGLPAFLEAGPPPVYVGFGSMPMSASADIGRVVLAAIRAQGHRAVMARGWADLAAVDDRGDCFTVGEVNQQALFGQVAAVVHHGGAGTTTAAARAGAPQVVVPQAADQPYWAGRVTDLGIGAAHEGPVPTIESLSAALGAALAPPVRARAAALSTAIRADGAQVAAARLIDTIGGKRP